MRLLLLVFILVLNIDVAEVRLKYSQALTDPLVTEELYLDFTTLSEKNKGILLGYKGAVLTLKAKHSTILKEKRAFFKEGVALLESAIEANPNNLELRFIRISIQENAPKIVKYRSNIEEDKLLILRDYKNEKVTAVKQLIKDYVGTSSLFTPEEKQLF